MNGQKKFGYVDLLLLGAILIWGIHPTLCKIGFKEVSNLAFNLTRFIIASLTCWVFLLMKEKNWKVEKKDFLGIVSIGLVGFFLNHSFFIIGIKYTTAGNNSLIFATLPLIVTFLSIVLKIEQPKLSQILGSMVSFTGIMVVILSASGNLGSFKNYYYGNLMIVFSTTSWALYTILNRKYLSKYSPLKLCTYGVTSATIMMLIVWHGELLKQDWSGVGLITWSTMIYSGALSIVVASVLWNVGISKAGGSKTSIYSNVTPIISITCGVVFLHESFRFQQIIGVVLVFIGLYISKMDINNRGLKTRKYALYNGTGIK